MPAAGCSGRLNTVSLMLVRGVGDMGSTVALMLLRAGYHVLLHDRAKPAYARRTVAFTDALFEGTATVDGVTANRARGLNDVPHMLECGRAVPVCDHAIDEARCDGSARRRHRRAYAKAQ